MFRWLFTLNLILQLLRCLENSSFAVYSISCVGFDPVEVLVYSGIDAWVSFFSASVTPAHNSDLVIEE